MDESGQNPCNICNHKNCDECVLDRSIYNDRYCAAHDCFLNYEGSCLISVSEDCGCRKEYDCKEG